MSDPFHYVGSLADSVEIPADGILSRTLYSNDRIKAVVFGFSAGQELSTTRRPYLR